MCKVCGPIVGTSNSKDRFDRWIRLRIASSSSQLRTEKIVILSFRIGVEIQNIQERSQWRFTQPLLILLQTDLQCCLDFEHIVNIIVMRVFYLFICFCCLFLTTSLIICHANLSVRSRMTTYHTHAFDHHQRFSIKSQNHIDLHTKIDISKWSKLWWSIYESRWYICFSGAVAWERDGDFVCSTRNLVQQ